MMRIRKACATMIAALSIVSLLASKTPVWAAFATEATQIANNLQLLLIQIREVESLIKQAQQISNQLSMLRDMATQARSLSSHDWGRAFSDIQTLGTIMRRGQALAYSSRNLEQEFSRRFKDYDHYRRHHGTPESYASQFKTWNQTTLETTGATLANLKMHADQFLTEEQTLQTLQRQSQTAAGRMQAVQASNLIAAQQVRQLQKLRELQMSQMSMQATYLSAQTAREAAQQAAYDGFMKPSGKPIIGDGKRY